MGLGEPGVLGQDFLVGSMRRERGRSPRRRRHGRRNRLVNASRSALGVVAGSVERLGSKPGVVAGRDEQDGQGARPLAVGNDCFQAEPEVVLPLGIFIGRAGRHVNQLPCDFRGGRVAQPVGFDALLDHAAKRRKAHRHLLEKAIGPEGNLIGVILRRTRPGIAVGEFIMAGKNDEKIDPPAVFGQFLVHPLQVDARLGQDVKPNPAPW